MASEQTALTVTGLEKTYQGGAHALRGVSFTVQKGDFFALLGPNGAGKTTLIGILTGLVNKTGGSAEVFGVSLDAHPAKVRSFIGLVPQEVNLNPFEKPIDIVVNQAGYYGVPRSVAIPRARRILTDLGLGEKITRRVTELSGGMKRRLMVARAIIHEPKLLMLDEPTAGVDVEMRRSLWTYLTELTRKGVTIILTTHYLEEAEQLAKNVAIINQGSIVASGAMQEILALHDESAHDHLPADKRNYRGGRLEEVFLQLTRPQNP